MAIHYSNNQSITAPLAIKPQHIKAVCSPTGNYNTKPVEKDWQDQLEDHLAMVHYHQMALLELARSESVPDTDDWEYGAYLTSLKLQQQGEYLLEQLSSSQPPN